MIRSAVLFLGVFSTCAAFAMPKVGDIAIWNIAFTFSGQTAQYQGEAKLVSFDATSGQFDEQYTLSDAAGDSQTSDQFVNSNQLLSDAQVADVLSNCAGYGGKSETVTVPAGTFDTCALPQAHDQQIGTAWIGNVSFGIVREDLTDQQRGTRTVSELQSQVSGR